MSKKFLAQEKEWLLKDLDDKQVFDDFLNENYPPITICGLEYNTAWALERLDEIAYRCMFSDFTSVEKQLRYVCPICGKEYIGSDAEECANVCCFPYYTKSNYSQSSNDMYRLLDDLMKQHGVNIEVSFKEIEIEQDTILSLPDEVAQEFLDGNFYLIVISDNDETLKTCYYIGLDTDIKNIANAINAALKSCDETTYYYGL